MNGFRKKETRITVDAMMMLMLLSISDTGRVNQTRNHAALSAEL
jgi:hypothetical protein